MSVRDYLRLLRLLTAGLCACLLLFGSAAHAYRPAGLRDLTPDRLAKANARAAKHTDAMQGLLERARNALAAMAEVRTGNEELQPAGQLDEAVRIARRRELVVRRGLVYQPTGYKYQPPSPEFLRFVYELQQPSLNEFYNTYDSIMTAIGRGSRPDMSVQRWLDTARRRRDRLAQIAQQSADDNDMPRPAKRRATDPPAEESWTVHDEDMQRVIASAIVRATLGVQHVTPPAVQRVMPLSFTEPPPPRRSVSDAVAEAWRRYRMRVHTSQLLQTFASPHADRRLGAEGYAAALLLCRMRDRPVIAAGRSSPNKFRTVGATSARMPDSFS